MQEHMDDPLTCTARPPGGAGTWMYPLTPRPAANPGDPTASIRMLFPESAQLHQLRAHSQ